MGRILQETQLYNIEAIGGKERNTRTEQQQQPSDIYLYHRDWHIWFRFWIFYLFFFFYKVKIIALYVHCCHTPVLLLHVTILSHRYKNEMMIIQCVCVCVCVRVCVCACVLPTEWTYLPHFQRRAAMNPTSPITHGSLSPPQLASLQPGLVPLTWR